MSNEYPLVSVIITTVGADYVSKAVNSVKSQTYKNIEIIICYDGVQFDAFEEKITSEFSDIKILNVGPFNNANNARQTGIEHANGNFIALLDDDDFWDKKHIEYNINMLSKMDEHILLISNSILMINGKQIGKLPERYYNENEETVADYLFVRKNNKKTLMQTSSLFFNRELGLICPFDRNLTLHQDYDWVIRVSELKNIKIKQTAFDTSFYVLDANMNSISKKSKAYKSIDWAEKRLSKYSEKINYSFFRYNTLWFLRDENFFKKIAIVRSAVYKLNINNFHYLCLILLCVYGLLKKILKFRF